MLKHVPESPELQEAFERIQKESNSRHGRESSKKGHNAEVRALTLLSDTGARPRWIQDVRHATHYEDQRGIDLVVITGIGPLYVQIKSSRGGALRYKLRRRKALVVTVVIPPHATPDTLQRKLFGAVCYLRKEVRAIRQRRLRRQKHR